MNPNPTITMPMPSTAAPGHFSFADTDVAVDGALLPDRTKPHAAIKRMPKRSRLLGLLMAFSLLGGFSIQAEVLVYQFRTSGKVIASGDEYSYSSRGYIVWNLGDNHLTWVSYAAGEGYKVYRITDGTPVVASFTGRREKRHTTFSGANSDSGRYFQDFNRGRAVVLKHRTGQTIEFPRTFKGLSHTFSSAGLTSRLDDNSHTMVYLQARTVAANDADKTSGEVVSDLVAELEANGYVESLPAPSPVITLSSSFMLNDALPIRITSTNAPTGAE